MKLIYYLISSFLLIKISYQTAEADIVKSLPDYSYKGRLYSGYLAASPVKQFHYMFNIAHEDPDHKPLVLWFNGGPGCSSLDGWSSEHGPMQLDDDGNLQSTFVSKYGYAHNLDVHDLPDINNITTMVRNFNEVITNYLTNGNV